jgi:serine/threonine protein kinase
MMQPSKILDGKYEIISEIKKGGFGIVYYGFDRNLGKAVAIKEIAPELLEEARFIDLFQAEARNAAKLNHHNIVHIFDLLKTPDGHFYIIMEYIDGVDLYKVIRRSKQLNKKLSINLVTYIIGEVCKALEYAHNRKDVLTGEPLNLVHQDISPSNIMLSMKGDVKIIDFGIARIRYEQKINTKIEVMGGKLPYMSPEQLNGHILIDGRADIFSLGAIFYELISGVRAFQGNSDKEIMEQIQAGKFNVKPLQLAQVPDALQYIITRAVHPNLEERYQSANQMYLDLAQYLMLASRTIEMSEELGEYVKSLFFIKEEIEYPEAIQLNPNEIPETKAPEQLIQNEIDPVISDDETIALIDQDLFTQNLATKHETSNSGKQGPPPPSPFDDPEFQKILARAGLESGPESLSETEPPQQNPAVNQEDDITKWDIRDIQSSLGLNEKKLESDFDIEKDLQSDDLAKISPAPKPVIDSVLPEPENKKPESTSSSLPFPKSKGESETSRNFTPMVPPPAIPRFEEEEAGDDIKTVIDIVRLASRSYKRQIVAGIAGFILLGMIFLVMDVFLKWTSVGNGLSNFFFPPAIKIVSFPSGAQVYLDDKLMDGKTPISIQNISPGVHKLKLTSPGFTPIIKSINVPEKGDVKVEGLKKATGSDAFIFHFMATIELQSFPSKARVYLNDVKLNQETSCEIQWEVGKTLTIEMEKEGFQRLTGFTFNLLEIEDQLESNRFWRINRAKGEGANQNSRFVVEGFFRKMVQIQSIPTGANIYLDDDPKPAGKTGAGGIIYLTFGVHTLKIEKNGFNPELIELTVDETTVSKMNVMLSRNVRFHSRDSQLASDGDAGARLVQLINNGRKTMINKTTPFELKLNAVPYEALFAKPGYKDVLVSISPNQSMVAVQMEGNLVSMQIIVTHALTNEPLKNVQVYYRDVNDTQTEEKFLKLTDERGICIADLPTGQYIFKIARDGFFQKRTNFTVNQRAENIVRIGLVEQ